MKSGNVNMLAMTRQRRLLRTRMWLRSETVVMMARMRNVTYMEPNVITSEPTHMASSLDVAR